MQPYVSVIMPIFKQAAFVGAALASLWAQTLQDWELIIVDDGSTDDIDAAIAPFLHNEPHLLVVEEGCGPELRAGPGTGRTGGVFACRRPLLPRASACPRRLPPAACGGSGMGRYALPLQQNHHRAG